MISITLTIIFYILSVKFLLGYAIAVLFPIPFLNSTIINLWSTFGSKIVTFAKNLFSSTESTVDNAVGSAVSDVTKPAATTPPTTPAA